MTLLRPSGWWNRSTLLSVRSGMIGEALLVALESIRLSDPPSFRLFVSSSFGENPACAETSVKRSGKSKLKLLCMCGVHAARAGEWLV